MMRCPEGFKRWTTLETVLGYSFGDDTAHSRQNTEMMMSNGDSVLPKSGSLCSTSHGITHWTEWRTRSNTRNADSLSALISTHKRKTLYRNSARNCWTDLKKFTLPFRLQLRNIKSIWWPNFVSLPSSWEPLGQFFSVLLEEVATDNRIAPTTCWHYVNWYRSRTNFQNFFPVFILPTFCINQVFKCIGFINIQSNLLRKFMRSSLHVTRYPCYLVQVIDGHCLYLVQRIYGDSLDRTRFQHLCPNNIC